MRALYPRSAELIDLAMAAFLKHVKKQFDIIIIDTPPIAIVTDTCCKEYVDMYVLLSGMAIE